MLNFLVETAEPFGLRLSPKKCELICFHRPGTVDKASLPQVSVGGMILPWKKSVIYLGSCIAEDGNTLAAIKHRICCAETVVKRLNARVFCRCSVDNKLKGHFIESAVFVSLLYGLAKGVMYLRYDNHLSYEKAEVELGIQRPSLRLTEERLRWTGHMLRSVDSVLYEVLVFIPEGGELVGVEGRGDDSRTQSRRT